jgi:hypothetical protein
VQNGGGRLAECPPLRQRQLGAERHECTREGAPHPRQHAWPRDDVAAHRRGAEPVSHEHHEGEQHEHAAQHQHVLERMRLVAADELRQEGEEEDRQLRIEDVDQDGVNGDFEGRARADLASTLSAPRCRRALQAIHSR